MAVKDVVTVQGEICCRFVLTIQKCRKDDSTGSYFLQGNWRHTTVKKNVEILQTFQAAVLLFANGEDK